MGLIGVTELLEDPDFVDDMQVITRSPFVDTLGQNYFREIVLNTFGAVVPASGKQVEKLPEAMRVEDISVFYFKGTITAVAPGKYSSILVFQGKRYQVKKVNDFSNWGPGYTEGLCVGEIPAP